MYDNIYTGQRIRYKNLYILFPSPHAEMCPVNLINRTISWNYRWGKSVANAGFLIQASVRAIRNVQ